MADKNTYDVIIIGAGPAGIFAALELTADHVQNRPRVLLVEKGRDLDARKKCDLLCGWGGAGAYSDGKLNLSPAVGGQLEKFVPLTTLADLIAAVDRTYVQYGANATIYGDDSDAVARIKRQAALAGLKLVVSRIRHIGTEKCLDVLAGLRKHLDARITFLPDTSVDRILVKDGRVAGVEAGGRKYAASHVIAAPGREGSEWLANQVEALHLERVNNPVDIGVRVEVPAAVMEPLTESLYESKLYFNTPGFDDQVRTFCMCPNGEVVLERHDGVTTVNGHSYAAKRTDNTNFALLVSTNFTKPFREPTAYGKYIASLANMLGDGVIVQRLGDLRSGRRSTPRRMAKGVLCPTLEQATPGDLSFALPYRHLRDILEMLEALDKLAPGVNDRHTLLYGVEVKFYSNRIMTNQSLETGLPNLYAVGDGAGVTRGLVQASVSGMIAARAVLQKMGAANA
jgi:hypothetical protein